MATKITEVAIAESIDRALANLYVENNGEFRRASLEEVSAAVKDVLNLDSSYLTLTKLSQMYPDLVKQVVSGTNSEGQEGIFVTYWNGTEEFIPAASSGGAEIRGLSGYQDAEGMIHLTKDGEDLPEEEWQPFAVAGGGGGSGGGTGSRLTVASLSAPIESVLESATEAIIRFRVTSIDTETNIRTGPVTVSVSVGGTIRENRSIEQGENSIDVRKYLTTGSNAVKLTFTDSYGTSTTRNYTRNMESFTLEWSLPSTIRNTEDSLSFYLTPTGSGTKTIYIYLDGELLSTDTVTTSGRRLTKQISGLRHGAHTIEAYGELTVSGTVLQSNRLTAAVAQVATGSTTPVIAVNWPTGAVSQYTTISIEHMVIDPENNPAEVKYLVNGTTYATEEIDQSTHIWNYRPMTAGMFRLGIMCGSKLEEKEITVTALGSDIQEITDGLEIKIDPPNMTALANWSYGDYGLTLSDGFDLVNGGLTTDGDGVQCIKIVKGDRLTLNYKPFEGDARKTGKEIKVIYTVQNSTALNAEAIKCVSGNIGLLIRANDAQLLAEQSSVSMDTCEEEKTELDITIKPDTDTKLLSIWESCSTFAYSEYASNENFTQSAPVGVTFGSDQCDVLLYLFRAYSRDLTESELKANFAYDGKDGAEILARHTRNQIYDSTCGIDLTAVAALNPNLHVMTWHGERFSLGKKDGVNGYLTHVYTAGGSGHSFTAYMTVDKVQGTSSVEHAPYAGGNQDFDFAADGITLEDGTKQGGYAMSSTAKAVPYITYKKNIASQDHIINKAMSEWYHRYQPSLRDARKNDAGVRDCMESQMAVLFFHNTGISAVDIGPDIVQPDETIFYGLGNLCNSKKNNEAFVYEPIVIEVLNNTEDQVRFKSDDLSNFEDNFEFRYLDEEQYTEAEAIALFQQMVTFVYECDYTQATNTALPAAVAYNGQTFTTDSPEYRKARWKAEAGNHFDMDSILYHQNFTLHYLGRDSRAKNMFWGYDPDTGLWDLRFLWDLDTFICVNNEGFVDIDSGHLDTDAVGSKDVFNAADNVIFDLNRQVFAAELLANYLDRESAGAWDIDSLLSYINENQEYVCESLWIEDTIRNNIRTLENQGVNAYVKRATGRKRLLLKKALTLQGAFIASYYQSTAATSDSASFRGYTPSSWTGVAPNGLLTITPYCNLFVTTHAGSLDRSIRAAAGESVQIDLSAALNDTEIYIRSAKWIQALGDMSGLYIGDCNLSRMIRLTRAEIGSDVEGYENTNFETASFDNCKSLEYVNLSGLPNAKQAFDFSANLMLKEIHTTGSGVTGLTFAKNGRLQIARLNGVSSLFMSGLRRLEELTLESYTALTSITIEDSPDVDSYTIVKNAANIARVRLLGINWSVPTAAYDVLMRLHDAQGIDDTGYNTDNGVLTGDVYFATIGQTKYNEIKERIPTVDFTYGTLVEEHTVSFDDGSGNLVYIATTEHGGNVTDPITAGLIPAPTKAADVENTYDFWKWDTNLSYIVADTVVTALFNSTPRTYTVRYLVDGEVQETHTVAAHGNCSYEGSDPKRTGYLFVGWRAEATDVQSDMDIDAEFIYPTLPASVADMDDYDYLYSDDASDNAAYTKAEFAGILLAGLGKTYFAVEDRIKMVPNSSLISDTSIILQVETFNHCKLADKSGNFAGVLFGMVGELNQTRRWNPTNTNVGGWAESELRDWANESLHPTLPPFWRSIMRKVIVLSSKGGTSYDIVESEDYLFTRSVAEMGFETTATPYINEVDPDAEELALPQYVSNAARIKRPNNNLGAATGYWLRSPGPSGATTVRIVYANGDLGSYGASGSYGISLCFCA